LLTTTTGRSAADLVAVAGGWGAILRGIAVRDAAPPAPQP
jgi:hypothetical protein